MKKHDIIYEYLHTKVFPNKEISQKHKDHCQDIYIDNENSMGGNCIEPDCKCCAKDREETVKQIRKYLKSKGYKNI